MIYKTHYGVQLKPKYVFKGDDLICWSVWWTPCRLATTKSLITWTTTEITCKICLKKYRNFK